MEAIRDGTLVDLGRVDEPSSGSSDLVQEVIFDKQGTLW